MWCRVSRILGNPLAEPVYSGKRMVLMALIAVLTLCLNAPGEANAALIISPSSLPSGNTGTPYNQTLSVSGGTPLYSWSVVAGALPAGLSLSPTGNISGSPSITGFYPFTVQVTDSTSATASMPLSIDIFSGGPPPPPSIYITTTYLPSGTTGSPYNQILSATGGMPPYNWSKTSGNLPPGLFLSPMGEISGTPSEPGFYAFTVQAADFYGAVASTPISLDIIQGGPARYDISGFVNYSGSRTGRIYVSTSWSNNGVSIDGPGPFTIRGVPPGQTDLVAWMDTQGNGVRHASDPSGSQWLQVLSTVTGLAVTISDPYPMIPSPPQGLNVSPGDGSVFVEWDDNKVNGEVIDADSYTIYWSTSPAVSPMNTAGGGMRAAIPADGSGNAAIGGLTNGTQLYFVITATSAGSESFPSPVIGPVVPAPTGSGTTVSGTVNISGLPPTGPLYVALGNKAATGARLYYTVIAAPSAAESFVINGVPDGDYRVFVGLDMNNDGIMGNAGDVKLPDQQAPLVTVSGGVAVSVPNLALLAQNASATLQTEHWLNTVQTGEGYTLLFNVREGLKRVVNITLGSGPNLTGPIDIGRNGPGEVHAWIDTFGARPATGDTYPLTVTYADASTETFNLQVSGVADNFPSPTAPLGNSPLVPAPMFVWSPPTTAPTTPAGYGLRVDGNGLHWERWDIPAVRNSILYNDDGRGFPPTFTTDGSYNWSLSALDSNGNRATVQTSFTTAGGGISGMVTDLASGLPLAGAYVTAHNNATGNWIYNATTNADGMYTIQGVPSGSYNVQFTSFATAHKEQWYNNAASSATATPVTVTAPTTTTGINAALAIGGSITGRVTGSTGAGVGGVWVSINDANGNYTGIQGAMTQTDGSYTVSGLSAGSYKVLFNGGAGYISQWYNNKTFAAQADLVAVSLGATTSGINAVLSQGGSIAGKVTDSAGAGIAGVYVNVNDANGTYIGIPGGMTQSDGTYTVSGVPAGSYKVLFSGDSAGYVAQWYDGKTAAEQANLVAVNSGATTPGINAVLTHGGSISGRVTDAGGAGIGGVWVSVNDANGNYVSGISGAMTQTDGSYTVSGLPTGSYKVLFYGGSAGSTSQGYAGQWYNNKTAAEQADLVAVSQGATTSGIDAVLSPGGSISGRVTDAAGAGIGGVWVNVNDANGNYIVGILEGVTQSDGSYTVSGVPTGSYKVNFYGGSAGSTSQGYAGQWYNGKTSASLAELVTVTTGATTSGVNAVLSPGGSVAGRVTNAAGAGLGGVMVNIHDSNGNFINGMSTMPDGSYTVNGLPAGNYKVFFSGGSPGYANQWYNNKTSAAQADPVAVQVNATTTGIDAVLAFVHTITAAAGLNGAISPVGATVVNDGATPTFTISPAANYKIDVIGGTCGGTLSGNQFTTNAVTADCSVVASFKLDTIRFTITGTAPDGNGSVICPTTVAAQDGTATCSVFANTGFRVGTVSGCGGSLSGNIFTINASTVTADCTVTASFVPDTVAVNLKPGPNGTITGPASITIGALPMFAITPDPGFHVADVSVNGVSAGALTSLTLPTSTLGPVTIAATFAVNTYTVTPSAKLNGSIGPNTAQSVIHGNSTTFEITPAIGYYIDSVGGTCGGALSGTTFTTKGVTADCTVEASFALRDGRLDLSSSGPVGIGDCVIAMRIAIGELAPTAEQLKRGDVAPLVNGRPVPDGKIDLGDAVVILRKAVGLGWGP